MKRIAAKVAAVCVGLLLGTFSVSATTMVSIQPGNDSDTDLPNHTNVNSVVFDNNPLLTLVSKWEGGMNFEGPAFNVGGSSTSGTWSVAGLPAFAGYTIFAVAIKSSTEYILIDYTMDNGVLGDNWCTDGTCSVNDGSGGSLGPLGSLMPPIVITNKFGHPQDISHLSLYGRMVPIIPEPATWLMMLIGFGLLARSLRKRTAASPA